MNALEKSVKRHTKVPLTSDQLTLVRRAVNRLLSIESMAISDDEKVYLNMLTLNGVTGWGEDLSQIAFDAYRYIKSELVANGTTH